MSNAAPSSSAVEQAYQTLRKLRPWWHQQSGAAHQHILPLATLAPWFNDEAFLGIFAKVQQHTLVDIYRCYELWTLARQIVDVPGVVLEVGVWRGGTGAILAEAVRKQVGRKVFLADTFKGVIKAGSRDTQYKGGEHADTSEEVVRSLLCSVGSTNTTILNGAFPEATHRAIDGPIAFLHCDVDVYDSTRDIVEWCLPRLSPGAIMVFDDYGFFGCDGVTAYCDELRESKAFRFVHNLNGHAVFFRTSEPGSEAR